MYDMTTPQGFLKGSLALEASNRAEFVDELLASLEPTEGHRRPLGRGGRGAARCLRTWRDRLNIRP